MCCGMYLKMYTSGTQRQNIYIWITTSGKSLQMFFLCLCVFCPLLFDMPIESEVNNWCCFKRRQADLLVCGRFAERSLAISCTYFIFVCIILLVHAILVQIFSAKVLFCLRGLSHSVDDGRLPKVSLLLFSYVHCLIDSVAHAAAVAYFDVSDGESGFLSVSGIWSEHFQPIYWERCFFFLLHLEFSQHYFWN